MKHTIICIAVCIAMVWGMIHMGVSHKQTINNNVKALEAKGYTVHFVTDGGALYVVYGFTDEYGKPYVVGNQCIDRYTK